jgi:hypothetical protein
MHLAVCCAIDLSPQTIRSGAGSTRRLYTIVWLTDLTAYSFGVV